MRCAGGQHENHAGAKFCVECGEPLALVCPSCGTTRSAGEKFCSECGTRLSSGSSLLPTRSEGSGDSGPVSRAASDGGARKVVTIVFADLVGSTALHERLDAESVQRVMERYYEALRAVVAAHDGTVVKLLGDGVMAAFGLKRVAEDDALRAVRAASAMQDAFRTLIDTESAALGAAGMRVAVNTGEVVVSGASDDVIGDPVNVAARLQEQGEDGDVVLGETTRRLVATRVTLAPLGSITLKGRAEAVAAYRLLSLEPPAGVATTPFVGRESELVRLEKVYEAAITTPAARLVVLLGSPGLGKSRLVDEVGRRHSETATILSGHCDAAGGATFAPIAQAVRGLLGLDDSAAGEPVRAAVTAALAAAAGDESERARLAAGIDGLLTGATSSPEETFFVVRRFLAGLAAAKPVVLVIDDVHWAEPLLLDLVEHLVQWGSGVPLYVLLGARPELRDLRSSLVTPGALVADVVTLGGLDAGAAMRHAANVIGASDLPASVAAKVLATSEGNPLFVGELVRMLVQEGALTKDGDRWTTGEGLATVEMPPTIHALLAARIERLRPEERAVLERASVVGRHFSRSAIAALSERNGGDLDARLEALQRSELIERDTGWLLGEPALRFHHVLIRDAAYRRLLKGTRAELHARLADWIEAKVGDAPEHDETIGWHLEQAHQHLRELGPLDSAANALGERASKRLSAAGRRALARDDVSLAASLIGRALDRLTAEAPERTDLALDWCEALLAAGDVGAAAAAIDGLERVATGSDRLRAWHTCFAGQLTVMTAPESLHSTADRVGAAARDLASLNDAAGEAKAHFVHAQALARLGKVGACEAALDQALAAARRAGDRRRANAVLAGAPLAALWGPSPVTRASGRCLDVVRVLRITQGAPAVEAVALSCQGVLEALRGRGDAARRMLASSRAMVEELGIAHRLFETDVFIGRIDLLEGNVPAAERMLRAGYEGLRDLGLGIDAARAAALLGRTLLALDRVAEAEELSHESERLAGDDLQAAIAWRGVRAEALAKRGDHAGAVELARAAVAIATATDALLDHADARMALAAALRAAGQRSEADAEERRAIELWEAKGATVLAERARTAGHAQPNVPAQAFVPATSTPVTASEIAALARFDELTKGVEPSRSVRRRVSPNAATATSKAIEAAFARRDLDAIAAWLADPMPTVEHPTGATYGREGQIDSSRMMMRLPDLDFRIEPLATLGETLCLSRRTVTARGTPGGRFDVGKYELQSIVLNEVDASGRFCSSEVFADDHLWDAIARLYERHAETLPDGPERTRAAGIARSQSAWESPIDSHRMASVVSPAYVCVDHRSLGTWSCRGRDEWLRHWQEQSELAIGFSRRDDDILAFTPAVNVERHTYFGTNRATGGPFENVFLSVNVFGADGRVARNELFEVDQEAEALARFDELVADTTAPEEHFANAASRALRTFERCWRARDWNGVLAIYHPTHRMDDRRKLMRVEVAGDDYFAGERLLFDDTESEWHGELLATRGERLALFRVRFTATVSGSGPMEVDVLDIVEVDSEGLRTALVVFDPDDLDAAYAELDARFDVAGNESSKRFRRGFEEAIAARDWRAVVALCTPTLVQRDHRPFAILGTISGSESWAQTFQILAELAPDVTVRFQHVRLSPHRVFFGIVWEGSRDGGRFEIPVVGVIELDEAGRALSNDIYEVEQLDQALARFMAPSTDAGERFANAAYANVLEVIAACVAQDWQRYAQCVSAAAHYSDRRRLVQLEMNRDEYFAFSRDGTDGRTVSHRCKLLATRGERLALVRLAITVAGGDVGPSEISSLYLTEVDDRGRTVSTVRWDDEDIDAAYDELHARGGREEAASFPREAAYSTAFARSLRARDWTAFESLHAPTFVGHDYRLAGWGTLNGPAAMASAMKVMADLAPDVRMRADHVRAAERGRIAEVAWFGTRDGGAFESPFLSVTELDADGKAVRYDLYDLQHSDAALARFEEIRGRATRDPWERILATSAAAAALTRWHAAYDTGLDTGDWAPMQALCADNLVFEDRRRLMQLSGGAEMMVASARERARIGARPGTAWVGVAGDRVAVARPLWTGGPPEGRFEIEYLAVAEVDQAGLFTAILFFDADDARGAQREAWARWAAIDPVAARWTKLVGEFADSFNNPDAGKRLREVFADDFVVEDHRRTGIGRVEGVDAYFESLDVFFRLAPDHHAELGWFWPAVEPHGFVISARRFGTLPDGGDFESELLWLCATTNGRVTRAEVFEVEDLHKAVARLAELRPPDCAKS